MYSIRPNDVKRGALLRETRRLRFSRTLGFTIQPNIGYIPGTKNNGYIEQASTIGRKTRSCLELRCMCVHNMSTCETCYKCDQHDLRIPNNTHIATSDPEMNAECKHA